MSSRSPLALVALWGSACWSPEAFEAAPVKASVLLYYQDGRFQGVTQGQTDLRAAISPPALLLGYDRGPSELGLPEGPLDLVSEGEELRIPRWAYALDEGGWRDVTTTVRSENLYKVARVRGRSICACAASGGCFDDGDPPSCRPCRAPEALSAPDGLLTAGPASCPAFWDAAPVPGGHFELCAPPTISCPAGVATAGECRPLIIECADGFPPGDYDAYVRPGGTGDGSRADPYGDLDLAVAASGGAAARIALAAGQYQLTGPYQGPALTLHACDPGLARLSDLELRSELRLEGVGFGELTARGAQLHLQRTRGVLVDLSAASAMSAADVDFGALSVRSSTAAGAGWRVRGPLLLTLGSLRVEDLSGGSLRVTGGIAELDGVVLDGGLHVEAPGRLKLTHAQVDGRPGVILGLNGETVIEDTLLRTDNATITVGRGDARFKRTWFVGPVSVSGVDSTLEWVVFQVDPPTEGTRLRRFHFRSDRTSNLTDVYASGTSEAGLSFLRAASTLNRAWLRNSGVNVLSLSGNGQLEVEHLRVEPEAGPGACAAVAVASAQFQGRKLQLATSGAGLLAQVDGEIAAVDVSLVRSGEPGLGCRRMFLPLADEGVGAAAYDHGRIRLEQFEILDFARGVILNNSDGALRQGRIVTPIAFNVSAEAAMELGLLRGVYVESSDEICEGTAQ